jgi:hypothetical protein
MANFLTITKGATTIIVDVGAASGATEREARRTGETVEVFTGGLSSSVSAEFREWDWPAAMMSQTTYEALRTLVAMDARVTLNGEAVGNVAIAAIVRVTGGPYVPDKTQAEGFKRRASLSARQA